MLDQPAPTAAPSSLPPAAAATHAPPVPRAQMAELETQKVAVAELARRHLQRPPARTGRTWHIFPRQCAGPLVREQGLHDQGRRVMTIECNRAYFTPAGLQLTQAYPPTARLDGFGGTPIAGRALEPRTLYVLRGQNF